MAVMLIESTDPNFSFYLKKNPAGGMTIKSMRSGVLSGWYPYGDSRKYALWFRETSMENSFSTEDGKNYLDLTQYASTYFVFHSMSTMFNNVLKKDEAQSNQYMHKITIPMVQLRTIKTFNHLSKMIGIDGLASVRNLSEGEDERMALYEITFAAYEPFNVFMMKIYLLFYLLHADLYASDIVWMEGMITKVVGIMKELGSAYFLWYWFKKNVLIKHKFYADLQDELGKNSVSGNIVMQYGNTQTQRKNFVDRQLVKFDKPILDVGCGGGDYLLPYAKKLREGNHRIVGVDIDKDIVKKLDHKLADRKLGNAEVVTSLDDVNLNGEHDILCIEVIEHMPLEEAKALVVTLMQRNFRKLIITTPNKSFNEYYTSMVGLRHDDHHFEFDCSEFMEFIVETTKASGRTDILYEYFNVGDSVNSISTTQACIITKDIFNESRIIN